ncbi:MAG: hypothetical protein R3211_01125 [Balneolaceae bacterium]|nr:hypothetical protein [Balneolaceae bacterium]
MRNEDNACIRYLMKEMDPSEEVLMERAMMEDEDLLIEVESLRQTMRRLDDLPMVQPPEPLTQSIVQKAAAHHAQQSRSPISSLADIRYVAAAAVLLLGFTLGSFWYSGSFTTTNTAEPALVKYAPARVTSSSFIVTPVNDYSVKPWVDQNDVIYLQDQFNSRGQAMYDSMMNNTTRKLKPIHDPNLSGNQTRQIQLTGANR